VPYASPRLQQAEALVTVIREALDASGLTAVHVTIDAGEVASASREGAVVVAAPELTFAGRFGEVQAAFEVHVIAGPPDNYLVAWDRIDLIIQAMVVGGVNLRDGKPGGWQPRTGSTLPAYTLVLNDLD
jgi:hypothetical protein